jgi:hypothetical protein
MLPEPIWPNSITVLNLASGPRCGTITRIVKELGMTKWTTEEGTTRPELWWPAMEELMKVHDSQKRHSANSVKVSNMYWWRGKFLDIVWETGPTSAS